MAGISNDGYFMHHLKCTFKLNVSLSDSHSLLLTPSAYSGYPSRPCKLLSWLGLKCRVVRNGPDAVIRKHFLLSLQCSHLKVLKGAPLEALIPPFLSQPCWPSQLTAFGLDACSISLISLRQLHFFPSLCLPCHLSSSFPSALNSISRVDPEVVSSSTSRCPSLA